MCPSLQIPKLSISRILTGMAKNVGGMATRPIIIKRSRRVGRIRDAASGKAELVGIGAAGHRFDDVYALAPTSCCRPRGGPRRDRRPGHRRMAPDGPDRRNRGRAHARLFGSAREAEHAGFAGPFTKKTLDPDEAWIGAPGGSVVDTTPWADDQPDDQSGPVEIDVNPDTMPQWTCADDQVDQAIKANHESSAEKNEGLDVEVLRKNIARRCRIRATRAAFPLNYCWTLPIMITGGLDAKGPADNDVEALEHNARWLGLNRRFPTPDRGSPPWYYNQPSPGEGCPRTESGGLPFGDAECDEYPMWAMQQAKGAGLELETRSSAGPRGERTVARATSCCISMAPSKERRCCLTAVTSPMKASRRGSRSRSASRIRPRSWQSRSRSG
jgi:hypothetical protein